MPIPYTTSENNEFFWGGSHCLKSLVICDSRFESQIAIAVKSRNLEHFPVLPFLAFLEKGKENHPKNKDFLSLPNPQNPWKRREKRSKKQGIPRTGKSKEF